MILMINYSYKSKESNTQFYLEKLKEKVGEGEILSLKQIFKNDIDGFVEHLKHADALVIGAPLYVDGLPAQAVKLLELLYENHRGEFPNLPVYVVSNLGFYEAKQIKHLLDIVRNWCLKMECTYGGGLAVGAGPMAPCIQKIPFEKILNKDIWRGLSTLATTIQKKETMENYYTKTLIPRIVYLKAAHRNFDKYF